jgi:hypothetical protein
MDAPRTPLVTFVTVNYKTPHLIRQLLKGVEEAGFAFPFEYIVVDNASGDGTADMVRERFPWARVIESPKNVGYGAGNNLGLAEARGEYVMLFNPDLTVFPGEVEAWIEWMHARPDVGISGPRILNPDGSDQESCYRFPNLLTPVLRRTFLGRLPAARKSLDRYIMKDMARHLEQDVDWVLGAAMLIRKTVLDHIGHFDERFFMYFEEADICRRAWSGGHRVTYAPVSRFMHYHGRESRIRFPWEFVTNKLARVHLASGLKYFLKHIGSPNPRTKAV